MPRALTNKQLAVLHTLRERGPMTVKEIDKQVSESMICGECGGDGCRACFQRGHRFFGYSSAYQALMSLRRAGLVSRTCIRDQFGDEIPMHLYMAEPVPSPDDPLEALWALPEVDHA